MNPLQSMRFGFSPLRILFAIQCFSWMGISDESQVRSTPRLSCITSNPDVNMFIQGEDAEVYFNVSGLSPEETNLELQVSVTDVHEKIVVTREVEVRPDRSGAWSEKMTVPSDRLGFFRIWGRLSNGITLPAVNTRAAGFITYGVTFDPTKRKLYPQNATFFGMQAVLAGPARAALPWMGVRWVLGPGRWRRVEPDYPGQFAEKFADSLKTGSPALSRPESAFNLNGKDFNWRFYPQFLCIGACDYHPVNWKVPPCVAVRDKSKYEVGPWGVLTEDGERHFEKYCQTLAKAVARDFSDLEQHYYEILWEPNIFYGGKPEDLVRYFQIAHPVIHAEDPCAFIIGPTLSSLSYVSHCCGGCNSLQYTRKLLEKGLGKYIDAYSIHPYIALPPEKYKLAECYRDLRVMLREFCGREVPIIGTEQGCASSSDLTSEVDNAQYIVRQNLIAMGEGLKYNLAFYAAFAARLEEPKGNGGFGFFHCLDPPKPSSRRTSPQSVSPKPQALAYAALTWLLEGYKSGGAIDWLGGSSCGYAYENGEDVVLALWDFGENSKQIELPIGVPSLEVYDWMGNSHVVQTENESICLKIDNDPVYLKGVSPLLWGSGTGKRLHVVKKQYEVFPGDSVDIACTVSADANTLFNGVVRILTGNSLSVIETQKKLSISSGESGKIDFTVSVPSNVDDATYPVSFLLQKGTSVIGVDGCSIKVKKPINIISVKPCLDSNGNSAVALQLQNERRGMLKGNLRLAVAGLCESLPDLTFPMHTDQEINFIIPLPGLKINPSKKYEAVVDVTLDSGYSDNYREDINFLFVKCFSTAPVIDGDSREWSKIPPMILDGLDDCRRRPDFYSGDSATIRYAWNKEGIYLLAEVSDSVFMQDQKNCHVWKDDCLQCGFCLEPWKKWVVTANTFAEAQNQIRRSEIMLALTVGGPEAWRTFHYPKSDKLISGPLAQQECRRAIVRKGCTTIYEAAFPWKTFGIAPLQAGNYLALTLAVNDRDSKDQPEPSSLCLFDGATAKKAPELMGIAYLAP